MSNPVDLTPAQEEVRKQGEQILALLTKLEKAIVDLSERVLALELMPIELMKERR